MPEGEGKTPSQSAEKHPQIEDSGFRVLFAKLRKRRIIETLAAFIGGGWLLLEFVHWLLVDHYHFPEKSIDITFVTILGALLCTLIWRWFSGQEKPRKFKLELVILPLVLLIIVLLDVNLLLHLKGPESETFPASKWKNSIAVLPFVDMSPQKDQEYFCDGMTEDLINRLSNIRELKVPARTSAFMFKGKTPDMHDVGEKLKVRTALEGSVQKSGSRLRITAQLINIADGYHLWSEKYDRELKDVFAIQDEISSAIVGALRLKLTPQEKGRIAGHAITGNLEAYNLYLQGRYFWNKRMTDDLKKAIDYFNQAIALDPDFALAYSGLADSYLVLPQFAEYRLSEALPKAKDAALKALAIDDALAEAHVSLASVKEAEWDDVAAENEYKRAIELNPNYPTGHHWYANLLDGMDRMDESLVEMKRALELDPLSPMINVTLAWLYLERREADQAIEQARKAVELDPNFVYSRYTLGLCLRLKGMFKEAVAELEKGRQLFGSSPSGLGDLGMAYALSGEKAKATEVLSILEKYSQRGYLVSSEIALVYLGLGEKDKALEWLDKVCDDEDEISYLRDSGYLEIEPEWDSLRSDPRYKKLLKKLRLELCAGAWPPKMAGLSVTTKKLLMSVEWIVPILCIFLASGCEKRNTFDLDYNAFDQRPGRGWRQLAENGKFLDAARLIDQYIENHKSLDASQRVNLNFHAGQMYAFADDYRTAIDRFNVSTYAEEPPDLPLRWNAYVRATIAFLDKDMKNLEECRKEILEGPTFDGEKANLDVVDRLIKHFDRPYAEAYGGRRD